MNGNVLTSCGLDDNQNYGSRLTAVEKEIASIRNELVNANQKKLNGYYNKIFEGIADFLLSRFSFNLWLKIRCDELCKESYGVEESEDKDPVEVIEQLLQTSLVRDRIIVGHRIFRENGVVNGQKLPLLPPAPTSRKARTFRKRNSATLSFAFEDEGIYTGSAQKLSKSATSLETPVDKGLQIGKASLASKSSLAPSGNQSGSTDQVKIAGGAQNESTLHVSIPAELQPITGSEDSPSVEKGPRKVQPRGGPLTGSVSQHQSELQDAGKIQVPGEITRITRDVQTLSRSVPSAISHGPRNQLQLTGGRQLATGMQAGISMDPKLSASTESLSREQNPQQAEPSSDSRSSSVSIQHTTVIQGPISLQKPVSNLPLALLNPNSNHDAATVPSRQYRKLPRRTSQHIGCTQTDSEPNKMLPASSNVTIEKEVGSIIEIDITGDDEIEERNREGSSTFSRPLFEMCTKVEPIPEEHITIDQPETMSTTAVTIDNAIPNANGLPRRYIKSSRGPHLIEMVYEAPDDGSIEIHYDFNGELTEDEVEMPIVALKSKKQLVVKQLDFWKIQREASISQSMVGEEQIQRTVMSQESRFAGDFQSNSLNGSQISANASQAMGTSAPNDAQSTSPPLSATGRYEKSTQASHEATSDASTSSCSPPPRIISPQHTTGELVQHQTLSVTRIQPPSLSSKETHPFVLDWLFQMKKYQKGLMPYTMFIKKDELRSWFEYLPQLDRSKSRYRCRLCYKFVGPFGIPKHHWGAMESAVGQLKKTEKENRDSINRHQNKASHVEVYNQLVKNVSRELRFTEFLDKNTKKELLRQLES